MRSGHRNLPRLKAGDLGLGFRYYGHILIGASQNLGPIIASTGHDIMA